MSHDIETSDYFHCFEMVCKWTYFVETVFYIAKTVLKLWNTLSLFFSMCLLLGHSQIPIGLCVLGDSFLGRICSFTI